MFQSIYSGVTGLQSFQTGIDVLANNIANVNTVGFRGSTTEFSNIFELEVSSTHNSSSSQIGLGSQVNAISLDTSLGSYYQTENSTDLAIAGDDGWFGLTGQDNEIYYSRAGNFHFDPYSVSNTQTQLRFTNPDGYFVTGTLASNINGNELDITAQNQDFDLADVESQEPLIFPADLSIPVEPTTQADFTGNIGLENITQSVSADIISPQNERNNLRLVFNQSATQPEIGVSWDIIATTQTADGSVIYDTQTGVVIFDESGALISSTLGPIDNNGALVTANLGSGFSGLTSNNGASIVTSATADGFLAGELIDYSINRNGEVVSSFTNGKQSVIGKIAIYHFQNDQGLEAVSSNLFRESSNSGKPIFYDTNNGELLSRTLENSNVTLDSALTELIVMQRSYDAASKTISTGDQMLQNALQMDA